jgi:hypothetical protein
MAVTITRTAWVDDDGTGTTGTVINNAVKTDLYNQIDTALAKVAQLTGGNAFSGNQTITGSLQVIGNSHSFSNATPGDVQVTVQNSMGGAAARTALFVGNDTVGYLTAIISTSSIYTGAPSESQLTGYGNSFLVSTAQSAPLRFATNTIERLRIAATGGVLVNMTTNPANAGLAITGDGSTNYPGLAIHNLSTLNLYFAQFLNNAAGLCGYINQTGASTVAYTTSSDQRLKTDDGRATDLGALRGVVVHDFTWTADGTRDRGIFAQEAHAHYPRAVFPGSDDTTETGALARPWMTDYSKLVPDLIVGWQQHDAALAELRAALAALKGSN